MSQWRPIKPSTRKDDDRPARRPTRRPPLSVFPTTLWEYPSQHYDASDGSTMQGSKHYTGATPSWVIWQLLQRYTREGDTGGGRYKSDSRYLTDKTFDIVDKLKEIAKDRTVGDKPATPAQVALAWVRQRCGVTSTIIGAKNAEQLDANLGSLEVTLTQEQIKQLDELSKPTLNFPHDFIEGVTDGIQNGTTINGRASSEWGGSPANDSERY